MLSQIVEEILQSPAKFYEFLHDVSLQLAEQYKQGLGILPPWKNYAEARSHLATYFQQHPDRNSVTYQVPDLSHDTPNRPPGIDFNGLTFLSPKIFERHSVYFGSDFHGDYEALMAILTQVSFESSDRSVLICGGDVMGRGRKPLETLVALLWLKCHFSERIFLIQGNHELSKGLLMSDLSDGLLRTFAAKEHADVLKATEDTRASLIAELDKKCAAVGIDKEYLQSTITLLSYICYAFWPTAVVLPNGGLCVHSAPGLNCQGVEPAQSYETLPLTLSSVAENAVSATWSDYFHGFCERGCLGYVLEATSMQAILQRLGFGYSLGGHVHRNTHEGICLFTVFSTGGRSKDAQYYLNVNPEIIQIYPDHIVYCPILATSLWMDRYSILLRPITFPSMHPAQGSQPISSNPAMLFGDKPASPDGTRENQRPELLGVANKPDCS